MWRRIGLPLLLAGTIGITGCGLMTKEEKKELELSAQSIDELVIDTESGDIAIRGDDKADSIQAVAKIRSSQGVEDKEIVFTLEKEGSKAKLASKLVGWQIGINNRSMDVTVTVPSKMNITLDDESGDVHISDMKANVAITDDSGDMVISKVQGNMEIKDQSGDIEISESTGEVDLVDGSGDIDISGHTGDITIKDESGDITVKDVNGSVTIDDDSGDIVIRGVEKDVTIKDDHSGDVQVSDVKGTYTNNNK